eukprot:Em0019g819a
MERGGPFSQEEGDDDRHRIPRGYEVKLNVYDMMWINQYTARFGVGAFHTGVEVHGKEYAYGGHPYTFTGVFAMTPKRDSELMNQGVKFRESISMGFTSLTEEGVREVVSAMEKEYIGQYYDMLHNNCNHFSDDFCRRLNGSHIPRWVNRLAYISTWMPPILVQCVPNWLGLSGAAPETEVDPDA